MSYQATVFNVMIASPGDVQVERNLARDVIHEWSAIHAKSRRILLQPVAWETDSHPAMDDRAQGVIDKQILQDSDLLVAIFWTRLGTPTSEAPSGTVEEIEKHMASGKPTMIYFSSAPVRLDSVDDEQYKALQAYRETCRKRGLIETFDSPSDFRQKFARHLASTLNACEYFQVSNPAPAIDLYIDTNQREEDIPQLTHESKMLLVEAANDPHGHILHAVFMAGVVVETNGKQFIEPKNPRSRAAWEGAIVELADHGLIRDLGHKGEVYQVTKQGYDLADLLKQ